MSWFKSVTITCDERHCDEAIDISIPWIDRARKEARYCGWDFRYPSDFCPTHAKE